jgi:predicted phage-related endonuclease
VVAMKNLRSKTDLEKVNELKELMKQVKELQKREKELKEHFKNKLESSAKCGDTLIVIDEAKRTSLDKKELQNLLGDDLKNYEKTTVYKKISLKDVA